MQLVIPFIIGSSNQIQSIPKGRKFRPKTMNPTELLKHIKEYWLTEIVEHFSKFANTKEEFSNQFAGYFDALEEAININDLTGLETLIQEWAESLTPTDLEGNQTNLTDFVKQIASVTHQVCIHRLSYQESVALLENLIQISLFTMKTPSKL